MLIQAAPLECFSDRLRLPSFHDCRDYVLSYDTRNRTAHWVFEHLTKESLNKNGSVDRGKSDFIEDQSVHPYFRSQNSDYKVRNSIEHFSLVVLVKGPP